MGIEAKEAFKCENFESINIKNIAQLLAVYNVLE